MNTYLIGQRVIINGKEIAVVVPAKKVYGQHYDDGMVWVRRHDGVEQFYAVHNVTALPGGQL